MLRLLIRRWYVICSFVLAGILFAAASPDSAHARFDTAYYAGASVPFHVVDGGRLRSQLRVGPWQLGLRVADPKPRDRRRNLYVVFPGTQHHAAGWPDYDNNCILNDLPAKDDPVEWDVYWAVVLDPTLHEDFRGEEELLLAAQASFFPPDLLEFEDLPSDGFLRAQLKVRSLTDLARFRRKDGTLPRLLILPAGFAIHGSSEPRSAEH